MDAHTQAVLFNAVPLLVLAGLYLALGVVFAPTLWRERGRLREAGYASALLYPCLGIAIGIVGLEVLVDREPLGGHLWLSLPALLLAAIPVVAMLTNWGDRTMLVSGAHRARAAERRTSLRDRELEAMGRLSRALLDADDEPEISRQLLDELG
ncbi:MAG: hypothetical protein H0W14_13130, partial [Actinobacteria bacterium]|nr:hypothetical protein [Actinomycetota bacterium]